MLPERGGTRRADRRRRQPGRTARLFGMRHATGVRFRPALTGPPGAISHWAAKTEDGIRVVDVWETKEQFERFAQEQIGPHTREVLEQEPETRFYDVHNHFAAG